MPAAILFPLFIAIAQGPSTTRPARPPLPYTIQQVNFKNADLIDSLCIIEAKGKDLLPGTGRYLTAPSKSFDVTLSIEKGILLDGGPFPKGASARFASFDSPAAPRPPLIVGKRYLVLGLRQRGNQLLLPTSVQEPQFLFEGYETASQGQDEISALSVFPTDATKLPETSNTSDRLLGALIEALPATSGWDRSRLLFLLTSSKGLGLLPDNGKASADNKWSLELRELAAKTEDPAFRVDVLGILISWGIYGSEGPFAAAVMDVADDPSFQDDLPPNPDFAGYPGMPQYPVGYKVEWDRERARQLSWAASNEMVREYIFQHYRGPTDKATFVHYVEMLSTKPRSWVDDRLLPALAQIAEMPNAKPVTGIEPGSPARVVLNHDLLVDFWQRFVASGGVQRLSLTDELGG